MWGRFCVYVYVCVCMCVYKYMHKHMHACLNKMLRKYFWKYILAKWIYDATAGRHMDILGKVVLGRKNIKY